MKKMTLAFVLATLILSFYSCLEDGVGLDTQRYTEEDYTEIAQRLNLPKEGFDYNLKFPEYYSAISFGPVRRQQDVDKITLGRVLFYDTDLSADRSVSCASCHDQSIGFSDDTALSEGIMGRSGRRNSLALGSVFSFAEYYGQEDGSGGSIPFLWDNSANSPHEQVLKAMNDENEMGVSLDIALDRVKEHRDYELLHKYAYGSEDIKGENIVDALAAFVNSIGSFDSTFDQKFDQHFASNQGGFNSFTPSLPNSFGGFTASENLGMQIYKTSCGSCHGEMMNAPSLLDGNNGLDADYNNNDLGIGEHSSLQSQRNTFKIPTLRNVALTAPYMHDGRFATLEEVVDHYSEGIQNHPNLSDRLKSGNSPVRFNFSPVEKQGLIDFLNTLTDEGLLTDEKFSNPFK